MSRPISALSIINSTFQILPSLNPFREGYIIFSSIGFKAKYGAIRLNPVGASSLPDFPNNTYRIRENKNCPALFQAQRASKVNSTTQKKFIY
jgi:hypothetical protein